jgi:lipopolysaccharide export system permease protein
MFIITRYIVREHIAPFFFGLSTIIFVFLLNVVFRDLGRLLGKGIGALVIVEFLFLNLAWILALAIPMAVLIAALMAFGRLSADNEISALKAGGVNIYRLIAPVFVISCLLAVFMERFNNCVLPDFNHRVRLLYSDISKKRPTLTLEPHVFFDEIPNYTLLVREVDEKRDFLKDIVIHDTSDPQFSKTVIAERGKLAFSKEQERMVLTLYHGEIHEVELHNLENYRRLNFEQQVLSIAIPNMVLKRSESEHRGDREKDVRMMKADIEKAEGFVRLRKDRIQSLVRSDLREMLLPELITQKKDSVDKKRLERYLRIREKAVPRIEKKLKQIQSELRIMRSYQRSISALRVEVHKKYSIPVACIVFVLIGAPLGIMTRQGGFAAGGGLSLAFFLIYWTFLIGGEQLADRGFISPLVAMWSPNILVGAIGMYLVVKTVKETTFIHWERFGQFFKKWKGRNKA